MLCPMRVFRPPPVSRDRYLAHRLPCQPASQPPLTAHLIACAFPVHQSTRPCWCRNLQFDWALGICSPHTTRSVSRRLLRFRSVSTLKSQSSNTKPHFFSVPTRLLCIAAYSVPAPSAGSRSLCPPCSPRRSCGFWDTIRIDGDVVSVAIQKWWNSIGVAGVKKLWNQNKPYPCDACCGRR